MKLRDLLNGIYSGDCPSHFADVDIQSVTCDSRTVIDRSLFVAVKGPDNDGADFVDEAIKRGARVVAIEDRKDKDISNGKACILRVKDSKKFLCDITQRFYSRPSDKIKIIGITGTNGKTTISYLLESILRCASKKCGVIGTVNYRIGKKTITAKNTTPGLVDIQEYLATMVSEGIHYCIMEVSSHALDQGRVDPIGFTAGVFTNLTGDHLDYHETMEDYFTAKARLFKLLPRKAHAVINIDDEFGKRIPPLTKAKIITYGFDRQADVYVDDISVSLSGSVFNLKTYSDTIKIRTKLIGRYNVANVLAAASVCIAENIDIKYIQQGIKELTCVPGRLERIDCNQDFNVFVDYAHTHDALQNVLMNLKNVSKGRIILVFGCGGDRDKTKRAKMGKIASTLADFTIVTSDNPRSEDPRSIVDEIVKGFETDKYLTCLDRQEAIEGALSRAQREDIVLIAGKGHEDYQVFKDKTVHFDDREVIKRYLRC